MNEHNSPSSDSFGEDQNKGTYDSFNNEEFDDSILKNPENYWIHFAELLSDDFPIEVFPQPFLELIKNSHQALNFPSDYTGAAILTAVATAVGKSAKLEVKKGWYEFPAFYVAIVGNPGANKSHPIEMAFKPFEAIDRAEIMTYENDYDEFEEFQKLSKSEKRKTAKPEKPKLKKTILHNFTPEILHHRLTDNPRGCTNIFF